MLIVRVHELVPQEEVERRYDAINAFEAELAGAGITDRSSACCTSRPTSRRSGCRPGWTTRPSTGSSTRQDIDERAHWPAYREAYEIALERTNTEVGAVVRRSRATASGTATWPSANLLHETLTNMNPQWPAADFDVEEQKLRLADEKPIS